MQRSIRLYFITCLVAVLVCTAMTPAASAEASAEAPATEVDVLVYGATPAGVCAAVAASREGASVALVSPYDYVGGMVSGGLSLSDSNQCVRQLMGGLFVEIHKRIYKHYEDAGVKLNYKIDLTNQDKWTYEPHVAEKVDQRSRRCGAFEAPAGERYKRVVQNLPYHVLKQRLLKQNQVLDFPAGEEQSPAKTRAGG